jgi:microcystin-dependent protein
MAFDYGTVKSTFFTGSTTAITLLIDEGDPLPNDGDPLPTQYALLKPIGPVIPSRRIQSLSTFLQGDVDVLAESGSQPRFNLIPAGAIFEYSSDVGPPTGFLWCDGTEYDASIFSELEQAIGIAFGSSGAGFFQVPDLRGRVPIGTDTMGGVAANRVPSAQPVGASGGEEVHLVSLNELPAHDHGQTPVIVQNSDQAGATNNTSCARTDFSPMAIEGGSETHNNMSPFLVCNYIIKT